MISPNSFEILASLVAVGGGIYAVLLWIKRRYDSVMQVFTGLATVSTAVQILTTNHLPHIQSSLDQTVSAVANLQHDMTGMSADLKKIGVKVVELACTQDLMKSGMSTLGQAFVTHLENSSAETVAARANVAKHEVQIDAILQAEKVKQTALDVALAVSIPPGTPAES